jgi:hypothetical protein
MQCHNNDLVMPISSHPEVLKCWHITCSKLIQNSKFVIKYKVVIEFWNSIPDHKKVYSIINFCNNKLKTTSTPYTVICLSTDISAVSYYVAPNGRTTNDTNQQFYVYNMVLPSHFWGMQWLTLKPPRPIPHHLINHTIKCYRGERAKYQ